MLEEFAKQGDIDRYVRSSRRPRLRPSSRPRPSSNSPNAISPRPNWIFVIATSFAEIDGVVTRRNVNPGDYVQVGQNLMAIRSLREIWVDANFKETELRDLRIGQPVDLYVDMYGGRRVLQGPGLRLYDGDRIDARVAAGGECDRQLRQSGPAAAGPDRPRRIRPGQRHSVHRHVRCPLRLHQQAAYRTRRRKVSADRMRLDTQTVGSPESSPGADK